MPIVELLFGKFVLYKFFGFGYFLKPVLHERYMKWVPYSPLTIWYGK